MRIAYADPPYIGQSKKHYKDHPDYAGEVDHAALIAQLADFDGWALSLSAPSLREILPLCPDDVRVLAWVKPFTRFFRNVNPAYTWEPVIIRGGRKRTKDQPTVRDYLSASSTSVRGKWFRDHGFTGQKPDEFCVWIFECLGMQRGDELVDLFPGSGAVTRAWQSFQESWLAA